MLLVILGAGASYDSVPPVALPKHLRKEFQPPLANQLLDNRPNFGDALDDFYQCTPLVNPLRRKSRKTGFALERELEALEAQADAYPMRHQQFAAFRFYLQRVLWECGEQWTQAAHGATNFVELLSLIDLWRRSRDEQVCVVTFNYDTMLEQAARRALGRHLTTISDYTSGDFIFLKLHGSVNWARTVEDPYFDFSIESSMTADEQARRFMIENVRSLTTTELVVRNPNDDAFDPSRMYFPALAIPVVSKPDSIFECPDVHLDVLKGLLPQVSKVLSIGWRGMEEHFLKLLLPLTETQPSVLVVSGSYEDAEVTLDQLGRVWNPGRFRRGEGFSAFLAEEGLLETWLNS